MDHLSLSVNDFSESLAFYDATLPLLSIERLMLFEETAQRVAGFGMDSKPFFWIGQEQEPNIQEHVGKSRGFHIAFRAPSIEAIALWHGACLAHGAKDNGKPGPRPEYHPGYYAAFVIDPNGYRLEAVLHDYVGEV